MSDHLLEHVLLFARTLRASGLAVAANATLDAVRALDIVGIERRDDVRAALRSVLVTREEDLAAFDRLFDRFWRARSSSEGHVPRPLGVPRRAITTVQWTAPAGVHAGLQGDGRRENAEVQMRTYGAAELWRIKDFAAYDASDIRRARAAIDRLAWTPGQRSTRRWVAGTGRSIDYRRVLRVNARHGEPIVIPHRTRRVRPRPLVLICDVSGSMEPYTRMLLLFMHALAYRHRPIEVFLFSTRLTRVTRRFVRRPIHEALAHVRDAARDWSGGTRIGEALRSFNLNWSRRVLRGGPALLLISDGWDLGDPDLLSAEMARVQRACYRLVWLNPLVGSPGYEPLARGMRAALPFVDDFLSVRNMRSLELLATHLDALPPRRTRTPYARFQGASEHGERATRPERAGEAARERACRGVRGAKPLG